VIDHVADMIVDGNHFELTLLDNPSQYNYEKYRRQNYMKSNLNLICFAINRPNMFDNVEEMA
jgi:hypothetical protein